MSSPPASGAGATGGFGNVEGGGDSSPTSTPSPQYVPGGQYYYPAPAQYGMGDGSGCQMDYTHNAQPNNMLQNHQGNHDSGMMDEQSLQNALGMQFPPQDYMPPLGFDNDFFQSVTSMEDQTLWQSIPGECFVLRFLCEDADICLPECLAFNFMMMPQNEDTQMTISNYPYVQHEPAY